MLSGVLASNAVLGQLAEALFHETAAPPENDHLAEAVDVTVLVSAFLPNEAAQLGSALAAALALRPGGRAGPVVCVYNTPHDLPAAEAELARMAVGEPRLTVLRAHGSTTKAENLRRVLPLIESEAVLLLDADARTTSESVHRAAVRIAAGADMVQGRNSTLDGGTVLGRIIQAEYDAKHLISYVTRQRTVGTVYFAGSNGLWRTKLLQRLDFQPQAYVEDVDVALRGLVGGMRAVYDPHVCSVEAPPADLAALWRQRRRWAFGWLQLADERQAEVWRCGMPWRARWWWTFALLGRRVVQPSCTVAVLGALADRELRMTARSVLRLWTVLAVLTGAWIGGRLAAHGRSAAFTAAVSFVPLEVVRTAVTVGAMVSRPAWVVTRRTGR